MDVILHAPTLTAADAVELSRRLFGLEAEATPLASERDQNFLLQTGAGDRFVLKIANATEERALLEAQNAAMAHVARLTTICPRVIPTVEGEAIAQTTSRAGTRHYVRLVTWIPGVPLGSIAEQPGELLESLGAAIAELDRALEGFDHPAVHREFHWDLARGLSICREIAPSIADPSLRALVISLLDRIEAHDASRFARLRRAAVHNDPNDYNVIVSLPPEGGSYESISGIIDFGDIVHSYAIADLAIAIAYAVLGKADPLAAAVAVVRGYQRERALHDDEVPALFRQVHL